MSLDKGHVHVIDSENIPSVCDAKAAIGFGVHAAHRRLVHLAAISFIAMGLSACASSLPSADEQFNSPPRELASKIEQGTAQTPLQCVPYVRDHSSVKIFGDAWTWWDQAAGKFSRGSRPEAGTVMVLTGYAGGHRGHVAVVKRIVSSREIRVDHANWLDDGSIYLNDPVEDVSADNDWSQVRVYNIKSGGWGSNVYPVQGFIGSDSDSVSDGREAPRAAPDPDLVQARATPRPAPRPRAAARRAATPLPPQDDLAADDVANPSSSGDDEDPLPNPDMVVSANVPPDR
jgi:surface antigen